MLDESEFGNTASIALSIILPKRIPKSAAWNGRTGGTFTSINKFIKALFWIAANLLFMRESRIIFPVFDMVVLLKVGTKSKLFIYSFAFSYWFSISSFVSIE